LLTRPKTIISKSFTSRDWLSLQRYRKKNLQIHAKTLQDLEFPTVLEQLKARCNTELGKDNVPKIQPYDDKEELTTVLGQTSEYLASFANENRIPNHGFDTITKELKLLKIENTTLELSGFRRIAALCRQLTQHKTFFKKFKEYYPLLFAYTIEQNLSLMNSSQHQRFQKYVFLQ